MPAHRTGSDLRPLLARLEPFFAAFAECPLGIRFNVGFEIYFPSRLEGEQCEMGHEDIYCLFEFLKAEGQAEGQKELLFKEPGC